MISDQTAHIHWYEGLFLEPHHLQALQRQVLSVPAALRSSVIPYYWGLLAWKLDERRLEQGRIRFETLNAIFPSGIEVRLDATPETSNAVLPELDISDMFRRSGSQPFTVALAVPRWQDNYANTLDAANPRVNRMWCVETIEHRDENTGQNARAVEVRKINARLIVRRAEDETDLHVLPLVRITPAATDQNDIKPTLDRRFVPATLVLHGSPTLADMMQQLLQFVIARREQLRETVQSLGKIVPNQPVNGEVFVKVVRLRVYDRYSARLDHLLNRPFVTPADLYLELRSMLAELASLDPTSKESERVFAVPRYDHDHPFPCFDDLTKTIRLLMPGQGPGYKLIAFRKDAKFFLADLEDKIFDEGNDFYVAVQSAGLGQNDVRKLIENNSRFILAAAKDFDGKGFPFGLRLSMESPPVAAPSNQYFFRVMKSESNDALKKWRRVRDNNGRLAASFTGFDTSDFQMGVCVTMHGLDR